MITLRLKDREVVAETQPHQGTAEASFRVSMRMKQIRQFVVCIFYGRSLYHTNNLGFFTDCTSPFFVGVRFDNLADAKSDGSVVASNRGTTFTRYNFEK